MYQSYVSNAAAFASVEFSVVGYLQFKEGEALRRAACIPGAGRRLVHLPLIRPFES